MKEPKAILTIVYYVFLILAVVAAMVGYNLSYNHLMTLENALPDRSTLGVTLYTIMLWYVIISLPLTLKLFSMAVKKLKTLPDDGTREKKYINYSILRITIISVGLILSILGFYLIPNKSLFWLAGISAIGLIFCKPTEKRINADLETPERDYNETVEIK